MVIISDTTCLSALFQVNELHILQKLYKEIIIPSKVFDELLALSLFNIDITPLAKLEWLKIKNPTDSPQLQHLLSILDEGEAHAIALTLEMKADLIILDDMEARKIASDYNLDLIGLGGVLIFAKSKGVIPQVKPLLDKIISISGFYLSAKIYHLILKTAGE